MEKNKGLLNAVDACADLLEELNQKRPELAGKASQQGVELWRNRIIVQPGSAQEGLEEADDAPNKTDLAELITDLLQSNGIEDVLDILEAQHETSLTVEQMINIAGKEVYIDALRKDASELSNNAISYNQIASLWNDLGRPALGGVKWNSRGVSILVA